jgi:hypothetical protein
MSLRGQVTSFGKILDAQTCSNSQIDHPFLIHIQPSGTEKDVLVATEAICFPEEFWIILDARRF